MTVAVKFAYSTKRERDILIVSCIWLFWRFYFNYTWIALLFIHYIERHIITTQTYNFFLFIQLCLSFFSCCKCFANANFIVISNEFASSIIHCFVVIICILCSYFSFAEIIQNYSVVCIFIWYLHWTSHDFDKVYKCIIYNSSLWQ